MDPKSLRYSKTHEWASLQNGVCTVGLSQFAVEQLTDIIYIELPEVGRAVTVEGTFGEIESVKSVNDIYSPINGEVSEVNTKLKDDPSMISQDPLGAGWLVKIKVAAGTTLDHLLTYDQYQQQIASEGH